MIEFYWSEDIGLLDTYAKDKLSKYKNPLILKNSDINEISNGFFQCNLGEEYDFFLIWNFSDELDSLWDFFSGELISKNNILILQQIQTAPIIPVEFEALLSNKKFKISKLNTLSRRKYILNYIKKLNISIEDEAVDLLINFLPNNALEINKFFEALDIYNTGELIKKKEVAGLLQFTNLQVDNFVFFREYFCKNLEQWIYIFKENILNPEKFKLLLISFCYKIFEFRNFLDLKHKGLSLEEISKEMNCKSYFLNEYEDLFKNWNMEKEVWFDKFILDLFNLIDFCFSDFAYKIYIFRYFLIRNYF